MATSSERFPTLSLALPEWVEGLARPGDQLATVDDRMRLAIALAERNVAHQTGGPFGAVVCQRDSGRLISVGVNSVLATGCSLAHAEAMALAIAQRLLHTHDLSARGIPPLELVTSAQPCCQCFGILWWSGVRALVVGARADDVERLVGFREGPLPEHWKELLEGREGLPAVDVTVDVLRDEALSPLIAYHEAGRPVYNPGGPG